MSFRKNKKESHDWKVWLKNSRQELLAIGISPDIFESEYRWWYFLGHGYDELLKWSIDDMSSQQRKMLLSFLKNQGYQEIDISSMLTMLENNIEP